MSAEPAYGLSFKMVTCTLDSLLMSLITIAESTG